MLEMVQRATTLLLAVPAAISFSHLYVYCSRMLDSQQQMRVNEYMTLASESQSRTMCNSHGMYDPFDEFCQCFDCWEGKFCSKQQIFSECIVTSSGGGQTYMYEDYWLVNPDITLKVPMSYHLGYYLEKNHGMLDKLERLIRQLHEVVGNAETRGKYIIAGVGSFEVLIASVHAIQAESRNGTNRLPSLYVQSPDWLMPRFAMSSPNDADFTWLPYATPPIKESPPDIEIVTYPNNPDSSLRRKATSSKYTIIDHAYYWPQFVGVQPMPCDDMCVATFSLSKLSGLASTRLGWAITSNKFLADAMKSYLFYKRFSLPIDAQLKAVVALEHMLETRLEIVRHAREMMEARWLRLESIFAHSRMWRIDRGSEPRFNAFDKQEMYAPTPAHLWIERLDGTDATAALRLAGIGAASGTSYAAHHRFARILLMQREFEFELMLNKMLTMVNLDANETTSSPF